MTGRSVGLREGEPWQHHGQRRHGRGAEISQLGVCRERIRWSRGASKAKDGIPGAGGGDKERC